MLSAKHLIRIGVNSLIGLALILIWLHFVNIQQIFDKLLTADFKFVGLFFLFYVLAAVLRSFRLKLLLRQFRFPLKKLIFLNFLSQFLSFMIPIRAGEIAKSVYLAGMVQQQNPKTSLTLAKTVVWVFIDRFLDFWVYILLAAVLLLSLSTSLPQIIGQGVVLAAFGFSLAAILMITSQKWAKWLANLLLPKFVRPFALTIIDQFSLLRLPVGPFLSLISLTVLAILSDSLVLLSALLALGVGLDFVKVVFANALMTLTFLIPAAPGYIGSAEASGLVVLSGVLGLNQNTASSVAVFQHLLFLVILPVVGITSIYFLKFNLATVWEKLKKAHD